tara:strand:- start:3599 stop:4888 length:1290 start_codon:yes stop_codon:yes gene_type:complete
MAFREQLLVFLNGYLPSGDAFKASKITDSNLHALISGFIQEYARMELVVNAMPDEWFPDTTETLIANWERTMGIPDDCFPASDDIQTRRDYIIYKLAALGLQTSLDFEAFAKVLRLNIKVRSGIDHMAIASGGYGTENPVQTFSSVTLARNTIVVTENTSPLAFDYDFDFPFTTIEKTILQCVLAKAKPAHCDIRFVEDPAFEAGSLPPASDPTPPAPPAPPIIIPIPPVTPVPPTEPPVTPEPEPEPVVGNEATLEEMAIELQSNTITVDNITDTAVADSTLATYRPNGPALSPGSPVLYVYGMTSADYVINDVLELTGFSDASVQRVTVIAASSVAGASPNTRTIITIDPKLTLGATIITPEEPEEPAPPPPPPATIVSATSDEVLSVVNFIDSDATRLVDPNGEGLSTDNMDYTVAQINTKLNTIP